MRFLRTNDGLVAASAVLRIAPMREWPHGYFHAITYLLGSAVHETHARADDVNEFLDEAV